MAQQGAFERAKVAENHARQTAERGLAPPGRQNRDISFPAKGPETPKKS
jgi:hypothetical protein